MSRSGSSRSFPLAAVLAGDRGAVARTISAIENETPAGAQIGSALLPHCGRAHVVGITGTPGAGKSTLINAMLGGFLAAGRRIAVIAVDPSSPQSGGAVLGDRVRMGQHGGHDHVFIRSLSARGHLGGVSRTTGRIIDVFDAAGFEIVLVETVGAGQSEVEIQQLADTCIVVCPPGLGDDVQAIKAGILEIADLLVVNKGDSPLAERTLRELQEMLHLRRAQVWPTPVLRTVATSGEGVADLLASVTTHGAETGLGKRLRAVAQTCGAGAAGAAEAVEAGAAVEAVEVEGTDGVVRSVGTAGAVGVAGGKRSDFDAGLLVKRLAARDAFVRHLGIDFTEGGLGHAVVGLQVAAAHINFHGTCHGGVIFSLADTAFGLASNSYGVTAVGLDTHMTFQVAVKEGDRITATASEISRSRKVAVYRIDVRRDDDTLVSAFTGTVYVTEKSNND